MDTDFLAPLFDWIAAHPTWVGIAIFLIAMTESLAIVGLFVPGLLLMLGVGTLIANGSIAFGPALAWTFAGAVVGDGISFWIGYYYKERLRRIWPFNRYPGLFAKGEQFFIRHGGKSILFGRFVGPVRPIVPVTAGMMGMGIPLFLTTNILSALIWAPVVLLPGIAFGTSIGIAAEITSRLALLVVALVAMIWFSVWLIHRLYSLFAPRAEALRLNLLIWGRNHPYFGQITEAITNPQQPELKGLALLAFALLILAWLILMLFSQFTVGPPLARLDNSIYHLLQEMRTPWGDHLMTTISQLGDAVINIALVSALTLWLLTTRRWLACSHWLAATAYAFIAAWILKQTLQLPRPGTNSMFDGAMAYGFPSNHTLVATCLYGFLAVLIARELPANRRWPVYSIAGVIILCAAFSRLYLGAHWLSDVAGGLILGSIWVIALGMAFRVHASPSLPIKPLILIPLATLVTVGSWHVINTHEENIQRYTSHYPVAHMNPAAWAAGGWQTLPSHRIDSRGILKQPLNLQFAGAPSRLSSVLITRGWQNTPELSAHNLLHLLKPNPEIATLPVPPQIHDGRPPALTLHHTEGQLLLRLWPADTTFSTTDLPLWVGYVGKISLRSLPLVSVPVVENGFDEAIAVISTSGTGIQAQRSVSPPTYDWQGTTYLIQIPD